jgi:hypothetical protein
MKVIGAVSGISIMRIAAEEMGPSEGIVVSDLVSLVTETYQCQQVPLPQMPPGISPLGSPIVTFQNGRLTRTNGAIAIAQIQLRNDGLMINAQSTGSSDEILYDFATLLNTSLGFRIDISNIEIRHASSIVIEFDSNIDTFIAGMKRVTDLINEAMEKEHSTARLMQFKRLSFGYEDGTTESGLDVVDRLDFLLERRAQHPFTDNRFFSSAPITTDAHIRMLERLENIVAVKP